MRKNLISLILLFITSSLLWGEPTFSILSIRTGLGNIISEKEPTNYTTGNFEIHYSHNANIVALQYKYFDNNPNNLTCEISDEITGKNFNIVSVKYGRLLLIDKNAKLNAFCGLGLMFRKINRKKSCPDKSSEELIGILPIELSFEHKIHKKLGMSLSVFTDLNLTEIMGGLILNLKIDFNL